MLIIHDNHTLDRRSAERPKRRPRRDPASRPGRRPGAARCLFAGRDRRGRPCRPRRRAPCRPHRSARPTGAIPRRHRLRRHRGAGRPHPHQQPRRRPLRPARLAHRGDDRRRPGSPRAPRRRRSRYRSGAHSRRRAGDAAGGAARRFQAPQTRPTRDRHRQSARLRIDGDDRRRLRARPLACARATAG